MKAFSLAATATAAKKPMSKKEQEKHKKLLEDQAAAEVYQDFVDTFEDTAPKAKLFVKGSVINPGTGEEDTDRQFYRTAKLQELEEKAKKSYQAKYETERESGSSSAAKKKGDKDKKKSNLELFKEELKMMQEEREERHRLKAVVRKDGQKTATTETLYDTVKLADDYRLPASGSFDTGDPNTTNIYLGNINPKTTEQQLMETFGKYGPLASVKIMWPRSEEERARNRNCGFVAYMNRRDGERALRALNDIMGYEMKLGWGKAVPIPPHPVYIPPKLAELTMPPPMSGLPFNAQPAKSDSDLVSQFSTWQNLAQKDKEKFDAVLQRATVKVVIPTDRTVLSLIHRMVEFVVSEGPMFEAMIMNRELQNPAYRFLFDNVSPAHVYYRWRLFSVLQGEHPSKWKTKEFRMFKGGPMWRPPPVNPYSQGMPVELISDEEASPVRETERSPRQSRKGKDRVFKEAKEKGSLSDTQREELEDVLRNLMPEKPKIGDAMVFCLEHADAAEEVVTCIKESLGILETPLHKKIARLYLISDILHNCTARVANASFYRQGFQARLVEIFHCLHDCYQSIEGRLKAEQFKQKVMNVFRAWEDWALYAGDYLGQLQNIFLGLVPKVSEPKHVDAEDVDGVPLEDEGDIDGIPIDDVDGQLISDGDANAVLKFKPSKWETIDPDLVEAQAMTTSKWDQLEAQQGDEDDLDGKPFSPDGSQNTQSGDSSGQAMAFLDQLKTELNEDRRAILREIEVKVLRFQDELESGKRSKRHGTTVLEQVEEYRKRLIKRELVKPEPGTDTSRVSQSRSPTSPGRRISSSSASKRRRSRSRSRSPTHRSRKSPSKSHRSHRKRSRSRSRSPTGRNSSSRNHALSSPLSSSSSSTYSHSNRRR